MKEYFKSCNKINNNNHKYQLKSMRTNKVSNNNNQSKILNQVFICRMFNLKSLGINKRIKIRYLLEIKIKYKL
jgi:hypothetical protein